MRLFYRDLGLATRADSFPLCLIYPQLRRFDFYAVYYSFRPFLSVVGLLDEHRLCFASFAGSPMPCSENVTMYAPIQDLPAVLIGSRPDLYWSIVPDEAVVWHKAAVM